MTHSDVKPALKTRTLRRGSRFFTYSGNAKAVRAFPWVTESTVLLLLLAAPTWLWGLYGKNNSPPASSVMDFSSFVVPMALVSRLTQSIHLCFGLPLFLLPGCTISRVFLPTYSWSRLFAWPNHLNFAFLHISVMFSTFSFSLMTSFLTWSLSVWPHAHLHFCHFQFLHVGASDWHCLHPVQHKQ